MSLRQCIIEGRLVCRTGWNSEGVFGLRLYFQMKTSLWEQTMKNEIEVLDGFILRRRVILMNFFFGAEDFQRVHVCATDYSSTFVPGSKKGSLWNYSNNAVRSLKEK